MTSNSAYHVSNLAGETLMLLNGFPAHDDQPPPRVGNLAILEVVTISLLLLVQQPGRHGLIILAASSSRYGCKAPFSDRNHDECQTKIGPRSDCHPPSDNCIISRIIGRINFYLLSLRRRRKGRGNFSSDVILTGDR